MTDKKDTKPKEKNKKPRTSLTLEELEQDEIKLLVITGWKRDGINNEDIAGNLGISVATLGNWKRRSPKVANALKIGREAANIMVENALMKKALAGNVTAQIYWLKNNHRSKYYETVAHEVAKNDDTVAGLKSLLSKLEGEIDGAQ